MHRQLEFKVHVTTKYYANSYVGSERAEDSGESIVSRILKKKVLELSYSGLNCVQKSPRQDKTSVIGLA